MAATYRVRFSFDAGAGICLWAANDATRERYGYAIDAASLPIPESLGQRLVALIADYDSSVNWDYPPDPGPWDPPRESQFQEHATQVLALLRETLGAEYEVVDGR
jgi:hypothetical protein